MKEEWRDIDGYEGYYQVSNNGRVRSLDRVIKNSSTASGYQTIKGRLIRQSMGGYNRSYPVVNLRKLGGKKLFLVHRLVAAAFIPNESGSPEVNHKDGNKRNNKAQNLEWCTAMENSRHYASFIKKHNGFRTHRKKNGYVSYQCTINASGTLVSLGYYKTKKECREVFSNAYKEFYGVEVSLRPIRG